VETTSVRLTDQVSANTLSGGFYVLLTVHLDIIV